MSRIVYAADIGSTRCRPGSMPNFAWVRAAPGSGKLCGSSDISKLAELVVRDLQNGLSVALGFEAPLFIPVPAEATDLCKGRLNEGSRAFAAPVGLAVSALGLHEAAWILRRISERCGRSIEFETRPLCWPANGDSAILFCWEAFVSGKAHSKTHVRDAATAAAAFLSAEGDLRAATTITAERPLSLIGAAALWSGLSTDLQLLHRPTVVIRPAEPYAGEIPPL